MRGIGPQRLHQARRHGKAMNDTDKLAKSWIFAQKLGVDSPGYEKQSWAVDKVIDLADQAPDELWQLILRILDLDSSEQIVNSVGAGPLEDLMAKHGESYIIKVEEQASKSEVFKRAMKSVWLDSNDTPIYTRFFKIAGIQPPL